MRAWIERVAPQGEQIELPEGSGTLIFGRSPKATLVFDDPLISARHCEVSFDAGFWRVRDLGSERGTRVNQAAVSYPRALFRGDVIEFGHTRLRFMSEEPQENRDLISTVLRDPDAAEPYLVWADWLQEHGDPLGERIVRARRGERVDHQPWLGPLWDHFVAGELEIDWQFGFVRRAVLRAVVGHLNWDWKAALSALLHLRVSRFVRELVVDLPRLLPADRRPLLEELAEAQRALAQQPELPPVLDRLSLGYELSSVAMSSVAIEESLARRLPALLDTTVFTSARSGRLELLHQAPGVKLVGVHDGTRILVDITRLRRAGRTALHLETPPGIPSLTEGNPCFFAPTEGAWRLMSGRMRGEVRVNGRVDSAYLLLPGDVIEITGAGRFRFELD